MGADVPDVRDRGDPGRAGLRAAPRGRRRAAMRIRLPAVWECPQPSWRQDVTREVDLIEEVARHYGLDKFPAAPARRRSSLPRACRMPKPRIVCASA